VPVDKGEAEGGAAGRDKDATGADTAKASHAIDSGEQTPYSYFDRSCSCGGKPEEATE
jgi:hypothetical protein